MYRISLAAALALILLLTAGPQPALGASFTVNATNDAVDASPGDGICADAGGACTLRAAIQETNALPGADRIALPAGTYTTSIQGRYDDAATRGDLDIADDLTVTGGGTAVTIVNAGGDLATEDRGVHVLPSATVYIYGLTVEGAFFHFPPRDCGGGILNEGTLSLANLGIAFNIMRGNGGGICNTGMLTLKDSTISGNYAALLGSGGGLFNTGVAFLSGNTISSNHADLVDGGGIFNSGTVTINNSTVTGNATFSPFAGGPVGGGIANSGTAALSSVTVTGNDGDVGGGGLHNTGTLTLKNSIVGANAGGDCQGPIDSLGHNLSGDTSCGLSGPGDIAAVDPALAPLSDNGGPTLTHALLADSPAIDAGSDSCPPPAVDQRNYGRPVDGNGDGVATCDIGAYEFGAILVSPTPTPTASPTPTPSPTPSPSPTATPTPTLVPTPTPTPTSAPIALPPTGGSPAGNLALPVFAFTAISLAAAVALIAAHHKRHPPL